MYTARRYITCILPGMAPSRDVPSVHTYHRILDGTSQATLEKGLRTATVQDILKASNVSRRTFYQYFSSKEDALKGLYQSHTERLLGRMVEAADQADGEARKVMAALDAFLDFQVEGGELLMQLHAEAIRPESALLPVREEVIDGIVDIMDTHIISALGGLKLDKMVYRAMLLGIEGMCIHIERQGRFNTEDAAYVRSIAQPLMMGVLMNHGRLPKRD